MSALKKTTDFISESKTEMTEHVTWSKYSVLYSTSFLVLIASLIFAIFIGAVDWTFETLLKELYDMF